MKQPIKMTPGDELHLTALMAPFSLNLVTGQDRQHLLGYGLAAFEAGKAGQCLHQIQEPAAAEQAAWHAGLDEGRAQAAPAAVAVPDFEEWRKREYPWLGPIGDRVQIAREAWSAALASTPAAAPVVLPEPALHVSGGQLERHCDPEDKNGGRYIPARKTAAGLFTTPLYTEQQVRALLAQAATAAAPAHPAEGAQTDLHAAIMNIPVNKAKLEHLGINERLQYKIGHRDARHDAAELAVAHAAPQAQKGQA